MLLKKTALEMEAEAIQELLQGGVLTNMTAGGRVRAILSVISKMNGTVMNALDVNTALGYVTSATGYFLDLLGQAFGVDRRDAIACFVLKEDRVVKFYVNTGVLKDYIPGGSIPAGTTVQTSGGGAQYTVDQDVPFADTATSTYVPATAVGSGDTYRVGSGMLTSSSITDANVYVTNEKAISNGRNQESDANYRYRILNHWAARATANTTALKLAALSTPGVADVYMLRHFQGPGTVDVLITPVGNRVTDAMLRGAEARINEVASSGDYANVRGPRYVNLSLSTRLDFTKDTPDSEKADVRRAARDAQIEYVSSIPLGGSLILQELRARTQEASDRILDHEILCFGIDNRPQILRNYRLFEDELFLPDPEVETPFQVL